MKIKNSFAAPLLLIVILVLMTLSGFLDFSRLGMAENPYLATVIIQLIVYALPCVFFCRMRGENYSERLRIRMFRANHCFFMILSLIAMFAGSALIRLALYSVFPDSAAGVSYGANWQGENLFLAIVAFAVVPAMTEEFLFRGIVLTEYESLGIPFAVILSSLLFSMMHLNLMQLPTYFYCGVILAVVLYTTRSVFASMAVHLMNNIATLLFDHFVYSMAENAEERSVLFSFILLCVLFVSLILLFMEAQRIYAGYGITGVPSPHVHPKKKKGPIGIADMLLSPALIIFVILFFVISLIKQ